MGAKVEKVDKVMHSLKSSKIYSKRLKLLWKNMYNTVQNTDFKILYFFYFLDVRRRAEHRGGGRMMALLCTMNI